MSKPYALGVVVPANGKAYPESFRELADYQRAVGGYIELVPNISDNWDVVALVNEDGRSLGLPFNREASAILGRPLVGNVVFVGGPDDDGDWTNLHWAVYDAVVELGS